MTCPRRTGPQASIMPCVNTGSKQGITNPPGDAAYNLTKAGIKSLTESLAHQLRAIDGCRVTAHLLVPGFTYTGMMKRFLKEKPPGAWLPDQVAAHLLAAMQRGDFSGVLCRSTLRSIRLFSIERPHALRIGAGSQLRAFSRGGLDITVLLLARDRGVGSDRAA